MLIVMNSADVDFSASLLVQLFVHEGLVAQRSALPLHGCKDTSMAEDSDPTAALLRAVAALDQDGGMSDVELEECRAALKAGRPILVDPLAFPGRKPEDRAAVQSRSVELTPGQALNLGGADVENALVLR
jgi:hypothetical protein